MRNKIEAAKLAVKNDVDLITMLNHYNIRLNKNNMTSCPFHNDGTPSFSIKDGKYKCFGCHKGGDIFNLVQHYEGTGDFIDTLKETYKILNRPLDLGLDKFDKLVKEKIKSNKETHVDTYIYYDENYTPVLVKDKYKMQDGKKRFTQYVPIKNGDDYIEGTKEDFSKAKKCIYNLPMVKSAIKKGYNIYFVEGEKDSETLQSKGLVATTIYGKTNNQEQWSIYREQLQGANIVFIGDTGQAGEEFKKNVWNNLKDTVKSFKTVNLPNIEQLGDNADVTDWLETGKTKDDLLSVVKNTPYEVLEQYGQYKYNGIHTYYTKETGEQLQDVEVYEGKLRIECSNLDIDSNKEVLVLSSKTAAQYGEVELTKGILFSKKTYAEILNDTKGFMIAPRKINEVQDFLYTQYKEVVGDGSLKEIMTTNKIGWVDYKDIKSFVYPASNISLDNKVYHNKNSRFNKVFKQKSSFETYVNEVLIPMLQKEIGIISISTVIGSLLLELLNVHESFMLDIYGKNGKGKTVLLGVLASLFGKPNDYIQEWNSTKTAIISNASELNNFPLLLDDTKKCDNKDMIAEVIYSLSGGKDKARANQDGTSKEQKTFKNITVSTGETSLLNYMQGESSGAGAFGRVISIDTDNYIIFDSKEAAETISDLCKRNYGTFGVEFCQWLYNKSTNEDIMDIWQDLYNTYKDINYNKVEHHTSTRKANHIAIMQLGYELLIQFLGDKGIKVETNEEVFNKLLEVSEQLSKDQDVYLNAYEEFIEYCYSMQNRFHIKDRDGIYAPNNNVGWFNNDVFHVSCKDFIKDKLNQHGDFNDILKEWRKREYILTNTNKLQKKVRPTYKIDGKANPLWVYVVDTKYYHGSNKEDMQPTFEEVAVDKDIFQ